MGAQVSTNSSTTSNDLVTESYNKCPSVSVDNTVNVSNVNFRPDMNPKCTADSNFEINQTAGVDAACLIGALQDNISKAVANLDATAQAGLGVSASTNVSDINTQVKQKMENQCGTQSSTNAANIKDTLVTSCNMRVIQNASAKSSCTINALQTLAATAETTATASSEGLTLGSFLFGYSSSTAMGMVVLLLLLAGGGYMYYRSTQPQEDEECDSDEEDCDEENEDDEEGDNEEEEVEEKPKKRSSKKKHSNRDEFSLTDWDITNPKQFMSNLKKNKPYSIVIILILVVLAVFIAYSNRSDKMVSKEDMEILQQSVSDANTIMNNQQIIYQPSAYQNFSLPNQGLVTSYPFQHKFVKRHTDLTSNLVTGTSKIAPVNYDVQFNSKKDLPKIHGSLDDYYRVSANY